MKTWPRTGIPGLTLTVMALVLLAATSCRPRYDRDAMLQQANHYLNLHDSVEYVGMQVCRECHPLIYKSYMQTGMGQSFDTASPAKSAAVIGPDSILTDPVSGLTYKPFWSGDSLLVEEFRTGRGQDHRRTEYVNYVVGSGQHTNSHIFLSGQYAYQAPFTYYTQDGLFDLPPGFEEGYNSRFDRKIGLECMSCHNGFPRLVPGSENKYEYIPDGIDCERCHGPGEIHVRLKKNGVLVDTSRFIDYSIVNPAKLPMKLQTDLCARCHLQGTMVLQPGKSFYDFKPGMDLDSVMDIFMPLFEGGKEDYIMASHYERMVQSACYSGSEEKMGCTSCHNPHVSKKETPLRQYNNQCKVCHTAGQGGCGLNPEQRMESGDNCVGCHMREGPTRDIPHVTTHDHKISIPPDPEELQGERIFKGLFSINNPQTEALHKARGYLLEYESYHPDPDFLDSAWHYLGQSQLKGHPYYFNALINYYFLKNRHEATIQLVEQRGIRYVLDSLLTTQEYSNYDAWTAYRTGQAYEHGGNLLLAGYFYEKAVELAPFMLDFQLKHGTLLFLLGKVAEAREVFEFVVQEDPRYGPAYVNLGYLHAQQNKLELAEEFYRKALRLNPDNLQALLNMAALDMLNGRKQEAHGLVDRVLELEPTNIHALQLQNQL